MKGLFRLKSSSCGCNLRTGTIIIGFIGVFFQTVFSIMAIITLVSQVTGKPEMKKFDFFENDKDYNYGVLGCFIILGIGYIIGNILLLLGVYMKKLTFVNVYIWMAFVLFSIHFTVTILAFNTSPFYGVVVSLILVALEFYCLLIVNSYYCTIKEEEINTV